MVYTGTEYNKPNVFCFVFPSPVVPGQVHLSRHSFPIRGNLKMLRAAPSGGGLQEVSVVTPAAGSLLGDLLKSTPHGTGPHLLSPKLACPSSMLFSSLAFDKMNVYPFPREH